jgi:predicted alpha/beta hydrolase family esterase
LAISINENAALAENSIEKQRRGRLDPPQIGQIDPAIDEVGHSIGNVTVGEMAPCRERNQQIEVRTVVLVATRHRTVDHRKTDLSLSPQPLAQFGKQMPVRS